MAEDSWAEQAVDRFFATRARPTRSQCDQLALSVSGASIIRPVEVPGSLSYTVICTKTQGHKQRDDERVVVSFRQSESGLNSNSVELARAIHGCLVPKATNHGETRSSDPPLSIYTMPLLPGVACLEALGYEASMDDDEEAKHVCFITHLAKYFARCWSVTQSLKPQALAENQAGVSRRLATLMASPSPAVPISTLSELQATLPQLFATDYPQVLTHGDLSKTNILVDPESLEVTGIVDWSLAAVKPFGMELDCLFLMTGCMDLAGWHDSDCQPRLLKTFWAEFWTEAGIEEDGSGRRDNVRAMAEVAAKIGALLRYGFSRNADGSPSEELSTSKNMLKMLKAWFGD
ncbi:hypothetical protein AK830_g5720 [Neonectria ditissima]|uniref:Uncharacterized protein n=1 Tax=Neonectria ditissima TaxID=78410 RepID=A0A0N8H760_9HYPO|nr:hypothetical protein AK830_g5720 [Neonectria ditissima]